VDCRNTLPAGGCALKTVPGRFDGKRVEGSEFARQLSFSVILASFLHVFSFASSLLHIRH
jgi:hypothetical protein